jgi:hypothetical protein
MPTKSVERNRTYCRAYYRNLKADPGRYAAYRVRKRNNARERRNREKIAAPTASTVARQPGVGGLHAAPKTQGEATVSTEHIIASWLRQNGNHLGGHLKSHAGCEPSMDWPSPRRAIGSGEDAAPAVLFEERAAIRQFDGGLTREDAEAAAHAEFLLASLGLAVD